MDTTLPAVLHQNDFLTMEFLSGNLVTRCANEIAELQTADELVEKGHKARREQRLRHALELYEKALTVDPSHELGLFWAGYCLLPAKDWKVVIDELYGTRWRLAVSRSTEYYKKLIKIKEDDKNRTSTAMSSCYVNLGFGYDLLDDLGRAEEWWQKAIALDEDPVAYYDLALIRKRTGRIDEAITLFNKAIQKDGTFASSYYYLGTIRMARKEQQLAAECFRQYLRYVDKNDKWEKENISVASDYIEFHNPPSEMALKEAEKRWKKKEAKMDNTDKKDPAGDPGTAIESGIPHTVADEKELHELFLTCWDQSACSPQYVKKSWGEMRDFLWRFGWRI